MQQEKQILRRFHSALLEASAESLVETARKYLSENCLWHGPHPINATRGPDEFAQQTWAPMAGALDKLQRHEDILISGAWRNATWVASTGHYHGLFHRDWLGIPANGKRLSLRFGEFARIENNVICEVRVLYDLVSFCRQCGIDLLPPDSGSAAAIPPPATGDGIVDYAVEPGDSEATLRLVDDMIDGLLEFDGERLDSMRMERFWTGDMRWYGPAGIGTTHGLGGFQADHQGPFLEAFPDRIAGPHTALFAEGNYVCVTGWPSVIGTHSGEYLGHAATGTRVGMRVMDFWRREHQLLAENWVLIDMLDLFLQMGVDLLSNALDKRNI